MGQVLGGLKCTPVFVEWNMMPPPTIPSWKTVSVSLCLWQQHLPVDFIFTCVCIESARSNNSSQVISPQWSAAQAICDATLGRPYPTPAWFIHKWQKGWRFSPLMLQAIAYMWVVHVSLDTVSGLKELFVRKVSKFCPCVSLGER